MAELATLLEIRKELKERKPVFIRQDNPKRKKLNYKWRRPKGVHSKIRHHFKGRRKMPSPGYKSPVDAKGLHSTGLKIVRVSSIDEIKTINKEIEGAVISKAVGMKRRFDILKKAKELDVKILNLNADEHMKKIEDFISKKKNKVISQKKEEKIQKKASEEKSSEEQKKEADKREKDKILTKKA